MNVHISAADGDAEPNDVVTLLHLCVTVGACVQLLGSPDLSIEFELEELFMQGDFQ